MNFSFIKIIMPWILFWISSHIFGAKIDILKQIDTFYKIIFFLFMGIGVIIAAVIASYNKLKPLFEKIKHEKRFGKEQVRNYQNFETIAFYLHSGKAELYEIALTYLRQHDSYPPSILTELCKIVQNKKPYQKFEWMNIDKRIQAARFICMVMEKHRALASGDNIKCNKNGFCKAVRELIRNSRQ